MHLPRVSSTKIVAALLAVMLSVQFIATGASQVNASGSADVSFASGAFRKVWERPDLPVAQSRASRSFTWGPEGWSFRNEPYAESPDGQRLVQYFDKTRMEITKPGGDQNSPYYVTNGLLVFEMVRGSVQEGDNKFRDSVPSEVPVAGDAVNNPGPTYRSFRGVASLNLDNKATRNSGQLVKATIDREGKVGEDQALADKYKVKLQEFNPELSHNIPDVFWNFMTRTGQVYQNGQYPVAPVIDWVSTMGFPLTEPYWTKAVVAGKSKDVLIQLFQRRVLTYTPDNSEAFKVEMGNVGAHYYDWRYGVNANRVAEWAKLTLSNRSNCSDITFIFSGQDNLTIEVQLGKDKTYNFGPGKYRYKVTGCDYVPYEKDIELKANGKYEEAIKSE